MNEDVNSTAPIEETPPEIAPNVLPPEPEEPTEEPVMIAANIDEMPQEQLEQIAPTTQETQQPETTPTEVQQSEEPKQVETPQVEEAPIETNPVENIQAPDLGNPEKEKEDESVPTFQQMPEEETNMETETTTVTDPAPSSEQITVPLPDSNNESDTYQAKSIDQVPTFQQMPEAPTTPAEESTESEESDSEEEEDKPKKGIPRIIPLIIIGIVLIVVVVVGIMVIRTKGNVTAIKTLRPDRSADSHTNVAILGHVDTPKADVVVALTNLTGVSLSKQEVESCNEDENNYLKYGVHYIDMLINDINYSINYPCGFSSSLKYLAASEGDKTVDGAILVVSAKEGIMPQTREFVLILSKLGINKMVVYIINDGDTTKTEEEVKKLLENYNIDSKNTPIVKGSPTDNNTTTDLVNKMNSWIQKETNYNGPSAVQNHKTMKIYSFFLTKEDGGMSDALTSNNKDDLTYTINNKDYSGKATFEEGIETIMPGDNQEITVTLKESIPVIKGMRVLIKQNEKVIGVGVISDIG